ncbi:MAG: transketolase [Clostridiales bacterium]|nr:transketolase [Clostridiales bacterium]
MDLTDTCKNIREDTVRCIASIGVGHIGGCLSMVEILATLYFKEMNIDPNNPKMEGRDRLIVSKGHAGPAVYATLANRGYFSKDLLLTLNQSGTALPSHCDMNRTVGIDMTTGSLGQGFSCAVGAALGSKIKKDGAYVYAIIGDGESQEGQIWEAAMFAASKKLNNLIAFTDYNGMQIDGMTEDVNGLEPLADKWKGFGWNTYEVDGHDLDQLATAIKNAKAQDKPTMIIAKTIKGKGVSFVEEKGFANHNMPFKEEDLAKAIKEIRG